MFRASVPAIYLSLALATSLAPAAAQLTPVGEPFVLSLGGYGYANHPVAANLGSAGFAVVWSEFKPQARLFDYSGSPLAEQFAISETGPSDRFPQSIAPYSNGKFVVAWQAPQFSGLGTCIRLQRVENEALVGELQQACEPMADRPAVAAFPDGGFVLGWDVEVDGPEAQEVRARVYAADDSPGSSFRVSVAGYGPSERQLADVGAWQDGFVVIWRDHPADSSRGRIRGRRYHRSGEPLGGSFPVSDTIDLFQRLNIDGRVAVNSAGRSVVVWTEQITRGEIYRLVRARIFDESGESLGPPFIAYQPPPEESALDPDVAIDSSGNFVIAWHNQRCILNCAGTMKVRLFNRSGQPMGGAVDVDRGDGSPTVALSAGGEVLVAYSEVDIFFGPGLGRLFHAEVDAACLPDDRTLCLNDGRFKVQVDWERPNGNTGVGRVVPTMSVDTGIFWFFDSDNWELMVKVLNSCERTGHYWVFSAATTNVRYVLTVTDTLTQERRTYTNQQGVAAPAVTDTAAFATCP